MAQKLQTITTPRNVVKALVAYESRKLEPQPDAWRELDKDAEGREGIALCDRKGFVLA